MNIPEFYRLLNIFKHYFYRLINVTYYSIVDLQGRTGAVNGDRIRIGSYYAWGMYPNTQGREWSLYWDGTKPKSAHNGVTVHSPTVPWDGTQSTLPDYINKSGETYPSGLGCWVMRPAYIDPFMAGSVATTGLDDYAALQKVLDVAGNDGISNGGILTIPKGTFNSSLELTCIRPFLTIQGFGWRLSVINSTSTTDNLLRVTANRQAVKIRGVSLTRTVTPISGAGIRFDANVNQCEFTDSIIEGHYLGFSGTASAYSTIRNVISQKNISHGIDITGDGATAAAQWNMETVLSQMNGGNGYNWQSVLGASQFIVGEMVNCKTALNSGKGVAFYGLPTVPLQDVRLDGGFYGSDGSDEIYLDTYGIQHKIDDVFCELAGRTNTGPTLSTAPSGVGSGIVVTANNTDISIGNPLITSMSEHLIVVGAADNQIIGGKLMHGDLSSTGKNAIEHTAGNLNVSNIIEIGTTHDYGVHTYDGTKLTLVGCNLTGSAGVYAADTNAQWAQIIGCRPNSSIATQIQNGVVLSGNADGGNKGIGTINTAGSSGLMISLDGKAGIYSGTGSPEGVVTASIGSTFFRTDGGAGTTRYRKESGAGNTGWVADNVYNSGVTIATTDNVNPALSVTQSGSGFGVKTIGSYGDGAAVTKTADFTVGDAENYLINNKSGSACVVTLPSAATYPGRVITIKSVQAQTTDSASANVVPADGSAASTAILPAVAGSWADLVSNGTNWEIMRKG